MISVQAETARLTSSDLSGDGRKGKRLARDSRRRIGGAKKPVEPLPG
jgi:hypothetical protein